jgi:shikimate dehydrogenase
VYENFSLAHIEELKNVLAQKDLSGFNITIPYKKQVIAFLDKKSDVVQQIGACNCVNIKNGVLTGHNTDVTGIEKSLSTFLKPHHTMALVLGTGGASAAVIFVLKKLGIEYQYVSREKSTIAISYDEVDKAMIESHYLLINTTPVGMYPNVHDFPAIPYEYLTSQHYLYDLVYNPAETKFLEQGRLKGASTKNGHEMLVLQAEESWRIWNEE